MPGRLSRLTLAATALFGAPVFPASAHHSYAMFNLSQTLTFSGTIAKVEWSNPHVFVWGYQQDADGEYILFAFESDAVNRLSQLGWRPGDLEAGVTVTIEYSPLRDGRTGGKLHTLTLEDGVVLTTTKPPAAASERP